MNTLSAEKIETLKAVLGGHVILPGDESYEDARQIWNAMIDRRPAVIVRCTSTEDVVHTVNFARDHGIPLSVRGGGHNIAGSALVEGGLVVDMSLMKSVRVSREAKMAVVEAGALLSDVDAATQEHGLATPLGINSTTGVAGLTLGGGFGWLSRKYGMTIDNLLAAEVVTADGQVVRASASEHPDLFWALRGGSGNFGVVTRFEFKLHAVGPDVLSGLIVYPIADAASVLRKFRDFAEQAPDELTVWAVMRKAPPLPFLPESVHGTGIVVLALCYAGDPGEGQAIIEPLRHFGIPVGEHVGVQPYVAWQQAFDPLLTPGARNYWKSHNFSTLDDGVLDAIVSATDSFPSPHCEILLVSLGGAASMPAAGSAAYSQRDARFIMNVHGRWETAVEDEKGIHWSRELFGAVAPYSTGGVYLNFLTDDERERVRAAYGSNYNRLARIKRTYDPKNLFRMNQNVQPA